MIISDIYLIYSHIWYLGEHKWNFSPHCSELLPMPNMTAHTGCMFHLSVCLFLHQYSMVLINIALQDLNTWQTEVFSFPLWPLPSHPSFSSFFFAASAIFLPGIVSHFELCCHMSFSQNTYWDLEWECTEYRDQFRDE